MTRKQSFETFMVHVLMFCLLNCHCNTYEFWHITLPPITFRYCLDNLGYVKSLKCLPSTRNYDECRSRCKSRMKSDMTVHTEVALQNIWYLEHNEVAQIRIEKIRFHAVCAVHTVMIKTDLSHVSKTNKSDLGHICLQCEAMNVALYWPSATGPSSKPGTWTFPNPVPSFTSWHYTFLSK